MTSDKRLRHGGSGYETRFRAHTNTKKRPDEEWASNSRKVFGQNTIVMTKHRATEHLTFFKTWLNSLHKFKISLRRDQHLQPKRK